MKNLLLTIITCLFGLATSLFGQCPPGNVSFLGQFEVDNFAQNYPNCTDLQDGLYIGYYVDNLNGLSQLESIAGNFSVVSDNVSLTNFSGLDNVTYIGGDMNAGYSTQIDYSGLGSLTTVEGIITIDNSLVLNNLNGLESLTTTSGIEIIGMSLLTDISALSSLSTITGDLRLNANLRLNSLNGLENLTSIGGDFTLFSHDSLTTLTGLDNLESIGGDFSFGGNDALTNLTGLENLISIGGDFWILQSNASLSSLNGLNNLVSIGGSVNTLTIQSLTNLGGLNNLSSVGGNFRIRYTQITNLNELINLIFIGGTINLTGNSQLTNLSGLNNLNSIGANLIITNNGALNSLSGLGNIDPATISELRIEDCPNLSICEVNSICAYLGLPNSISTIANNATGCSSEAEIVNACNLLPINEVEEPTVSIQPNPVRQEVILESIGINQLEIYNHLGNLVRKVEIYAGNNTIDLQHLAKGIYLFKLNDGEIHRVLKL